MAAPHAAGAIALLLSARPELMMDEVKRALFASTQQVHLGPSNVTCGGTSDSQSANKQYGHGRLNVRPTDV
uniref:subtilisin n=1 Tax=Globisporangium ultimum (strain ATCC 200006 / CBS 805.95 / DAOM BR144) TaxID=431595 RepID=K3WRQ0_GLOUD